MDNLNDKTLILIDKYHSGQASAEEISFLISWKNSSPINMQSFNEFVSFLDLIGSVKTWKQFDNRIAWSKFQAKLKSKTFRIVWKMYAAAAILLLVLAATFWNFNGNLKVSSPSYLSGLENRFSILSDGSELFLDVNSKIYTDNFSNQSRIITSEGSYFVNVEHDLEHPFQIKTQRLSIEVLGTSFKVEESESETLVAVRDGKVLITSDDGTQYTIGRNEKLRVSEEGIVLGKVSESDWGLFSATYEDESILSLLDDLSRRFGKLSVNRSDINPECRITTKVSQSTVIEILKEIDLIFEVDYTIKGGQVIVNKISC